MAEEICGAELKCPVDGVPIFTCHRAAGREGDHEGSTYGFTPGQPGYESATCHWRRVAYYWQEAGKEERLPAEVGQS